ncbi:MAG: hypothetical protein ACRC6V_03990 [Bacteroidales bacterium]
MNRTIIQTLTAVALLAVFASSSNSDIKEAQLETTRYCKCVHTWKTFANPELVQDTLRMKGMSNVAGHPDYLDIYESECLKYIGN